VLTNLIGNALEYTSAAVSVQARAASRGWLEVTVADHGTGLPAGSLEGLFEKTGPAGRNRSQGGLGLGLYLCRLVVERSFGGRIWVASSDRGGTTFKFTVPAIAVPAGKTRAGESVITTR
jgi:signal transduction histidine kinase